MRNNINYSARLLALLVTLLGFTACFNDLDTEPLDPDVQTANVVYDDPGAYEQVLAKLYAGLALTGQAGPAGNADIAGIDEGFSSYLRQYWQLNELPTDEAKIAWGDAGIPELNQGTWTPSNDFINAMYARIFYQITLANEFLRESTEERLSDRGQANLSDQVRAYRAEARFLRALSYYHALDFFRNVPFVTEEDGIGAFLPEQIQSGELYNFIESELLDIEGDLIDARANEYGRADKAAGWMLLSQLYLNAEVYGQTARYDEVLRLTQQVIDAGYELEEDYTELYVADNHTSPEAIFSIYFDGQFARTFGGTTYLVHAPVGGDEMDPADFGIDGGWAGIRTTPQFVDLFPSVGGSGITVREAVEQSYDGAVLNVPGLYQGWDPANDNTVLQADDEDSTSFSGFIVFPEGLDSYEFKFAFGSFDADSNYGTGEGENSLALNGGNLSVEGPGVYRAEVNLDELTYNIYPVEFGIIGEATPNGWEGDDFDMTYNPEVGAFEANIPLTSGEFKFRVNDNWDQFDFGDNGNDGTLEGRGSNLSINRSGTFRVRLFVNSSMAYTYSIDVPASDSRAQFFVDGKTLEIEDLMVYGQGYAITKYRNVTRDGTPGSDLVFADIDFHLFRLADAYLMYAEAALRTGSNRSTAVEYINRLRQRAYDGDSGNITNSDLTLDFILDERGRELYWEGYRRRDLIRFGLFTSNDYVWAFKGGAPEGTSIDDCRDVYPIPSNDAGANPNLDQNECYR